MVPVDFPLAIAQDAQGGFVGKNDGGVSDRLSWPHNVGKVITQSSERRQTNQNDSDSGGDRDGAQRQSFEFVEPAGHGSQSRFRSGARRSIGPSALRRQWSPKPPTWIGNIPTYCLICWRD